MGSPKVLKKGGGMLFQDRLDAAHLLVERLQKYRAQGVIILAIPRGAIPMGALMASELNCALNLVPVRKVSSPLAPEFALGAADAEGNFYPEDNVLNLPQQQLRNWFKKSLELLRQRNFRWLQLLPRESLKNRTVIIVDDGVATGATMRAALMWARRKEPSRIVVAVPVASPEGVDVMKRFADEVVCLHSPHFFSSVGEFYTNFEEVDDEKVCEILTKINKDRSSKEHVADL